MKRIISVFISAIILIFPLILASCQSEDIPIVDTEQTQNETEIHEDIENFTFFLRWGTEGQSSYNSESGELIKTTFVCDRSPDEYKTTLKLTYEQKKQIYEIIKDLDIFSYPDEYDPNMKDNGTTIINEPSDTVIISVKGKTVSCCDVAFFGTTDSTEKGKVFIRAIKDIISIITSSEEWKALPEYEVLLI